jgi:hypothetical protein
VTNFGKAKSLVTKGTKAQREDPASVVLLLFVLLCLLWLMLFALKAGRPGHF